MNPLQKMTAAFNCLVKSRAAIRRRNRRNGWTVEALELRTLLTMPLYVVQTGSANPMIGLAGGSEFNEMHPVLVDLNGDGDLDLVVGRLNGISYFENTGTSLAPTFIERIGALNPFSGLGTGVVPAPAFADWDADGDQDLLWATHSGLTAYVNTDLSVNRSAPSFAPMGPGNPFAGLFTGFTDFGPAPVPAFANMNGDLFPDLVVSKQLQGMRYFVNTGTSLSPAYQLVGSGGPFASVSVGSLTSPALGDVDGDGDADLVVATVFANPLNPVQLKFYQNNSNPLTHAANLTAVSEVFSDQFSIYTGRAAPALGDLDGDGDQDLLLAVTPDVLGTDPSGFDIVGPGFRYYKAVENPVAFKPKNTVPSQQFAKEDITFVFSSPNGNALSVADPNANGSPLQITLAVSQGKLTLATAAGLNFGFSDGQGSGVGDGINDATMTFRGTLTEINAALNGLKFQPPVDFSGDTNLTITSNDLGQPGGGAPLSDTDSVPINVRSVAMQVETLRNYINSLVGSTGLNQHDANALLRQLDLTGRPVIDAARINAFMVVVRAFGRAGILTDGSDLLLLEVAQDALTGITTRVN